MTSDEMSEIEANARVAAEGPAEPTPVIFIMGAGVVGTGNQTLVISPRS